MADDNRPLKYMRYAIGEIVLVVIGIFIALQLNSWKEGRKELAKTNVYIDNIIKDIVNDTLSINSDLEQYEAYKTSVDNYFNYFEAGNNTIDQYIDSALATNVLLFTYNPIDHTYKDLLASGNSNLFGETQRAKLITLSNQQQLFQTINSNVVNSILTETHAADTYLDNDRSESNFFEILKIEQKDKAKGLLHMHNAMTTAYDLLELYDRFGGRIKQRGKEAILSLEQQKNNE